MGFVKKSVFYPSSPAEDPQSQPGLMDVDGDAPPPPPPAPKLNDASEEDQDWFKFDDDKVSLFPFEKLATLDGGGQDSSAYVLLYRSLSI